MAIAAVADAADDDGRVFLWFSYGFLIKVSEHYQAGYNLYASHGATIGPLPLRIVPTDFPT